MAPVKPAPSKDMWNLDFPPLDGKGLRHLKGVRRTIPNFSE